MNCNERMKVDTRTIVSKVGKNTDDINSRQNEMKDIFIVNSVSITIDNLLISRL